jgi:hypothetical protein
MRAVSTPIRGKSKNGEVSLSVSGNNHRRDTCYRVEINTRLRLVGDDMVVCDDKAFSKPGNLRQEAGAMP